MAMKKKNLPEVVPELFEHEEFGQFRYVKRGDEVWFAAVDVCNVLEINNPRQALTRLDEDELASFKMTSGGQVREMNFVNEFGLYNLILSSRKPEAKKFKRWVTHEVLPSIRKYGYYSVMQKNLQEPLILVSGELDPKLVEPGYLSPKEFWEMFDKIQAGQFEIRRIISTEYLSRR